MLVNQTKEFGRDTYKFEARGTEYTVIESGDFFEVWSNRKNVSFPPVVKMMTLKEMSQRSKALNHLAHLINA